MSKHAKVSRKGLGVIAGALPTKYKSKAGLVAAVLGVALSAATYFGTDYPQVALAIQALTAFGFVEQSDSE
ncbi:membrane protein [Streptomyces phage Andris]|nr:membrane protein [Streptomyces phage Andris]